MKTFKLFFILMLFSFCSSCKDDSKIITLKVAAHKEIYKPPFGESDEKGYSVTDTNNNKYVILHIADFADKYEEGYEYVIKVRATKRNVGKDEEDGFGTDYYLLEIISKEKEKDIY